MMSVIMENQFQ